MENISEKNIYHVYIDIWQNGECYKTDEFIVKASTKAEAFEKMLNYLTAYYDLLEVENIEFKKFKAEII